MISDLLGELHALWLIIVGNVLTLRGKVRSRRYLYALIRLINQLTFPKRQLKKLREQSRSLESFQRTYDPCDWDMYDAVLDKEVWLEGKTVMDFGSGVGGKAAAMAENGATEVWGIDRSQRNIDQASNLLRPGLPLHFECTSLESFGRDGEFDTVVSYTVFEHIADCVSTLTHLHRKLKPGGHCLIVFNHFYDKYGSHLKEYIYHPWPTLVFPEAVCFSYWNDRLREDHRRGEMGYFAPQYEHGLGEGNKDCFMNLNALSIAEFEAIVEHSPFSQVARHDYSRTALLKLLPFLGRFQWSRWLQGSALYHLMKPWREDDGSGQ